MANITLEDIKKIPPQKMAAIVVLAFLILGYLYYLLLFQPLHDEKTQLQTKLDELNRAIAKKEILVREVENNKKTVLTLQGNLQTALTKLPDQKEIPGLLSALSEEGKASGLDFVLFEPISPVNKEFYAEIPVKVIINGGFHNTATFFEKVARLPRIVNIGDVSIIAAKDAKDDNNRLTTSCQIKTYMFVEKSEQSPENMTEKAKNIKAKNAKAKNAKTDSAKKP